MSMAVTPIAHEQNVDFSLVQNSSTNQILNLSHLRISLNKTDPCHLVYFERHWYFEAQNPFYEAVQALIHPKLAIDVGANQGVSATIAGKHFPAAHIIAVEPIEALIPHIRYNLYSNMVPDFNVIRAVVGSTMGRSSFAHNPIGSLDSRVIAPNASWEVESVPQITIESLVSEIQASDGVYIKIDTQGYEPFVIKGAETLLAGHSKWIVKMEFGPEWIESQGGNACAFLADLVQRFDVYEFPSRWAFRDRLDQRSLGSPLEGHEVERFTATVRNQFRDGKGWLDLLVTPRGLIPEIA